jgi:hypothetical protein
VATSADQQRFPFRTSVPKLFGKARPATNGIRTSTKYQAKIADVLGKVNLSKHAKNALVVSVFPGLRVIDGTRKLVYTRSQQVSLVIHLRAHHHHYGHTPRPLSCP